MTAGEIIDQIKRIKGIASDYALEDALEVKRSTVQQLRRNGGNTATWKLLRLMLEN